LVVLELFKDYPRAPISQAFCDGRLLQRL